MPEKIVAFEHAKDKWFSDKIEQQNLAYSAIFSYNEGEIDYAECQSIVFNCFQRITRTFIQEFQRDSFF